MRTGVNYKKGILRHWLRLDLCATFPQWLDQKPSERGINKTRAGLLVYYYINTIKICTYSNIVNTITDLRPPYLQTLHASLTKGGFSYHS